MALIDSISDFRREYRAGPYAWPGGYPKYFVMQDGEAISFSVAKTERRQILEAFDGSNSQWRVIGVEINWEDADLYCAHTNERIPSAYAEPEETEEC